MSAARLLRVLERARRRAVGAPVKDFALRAALMLAVVVVPGCTDDDAVVVKGGPQAARAESERLEHADDGSYDDVAVASALVRGGEFVAPVLSTAADF